MASLKVKVLIECDGPRYYSFKQCPNEKKQETWAELCEVEDSMVSGLLKIGGVEYPEGWARTGRCSDCQAAFEREG